MIGKLIAAELRLLRPPIWAAVLVAVLLDALLPFIALYGRSVREDTPIGQIPAAIVAREVQQGALFALALSCGIAAVFGCAAATTARRERYAELAAMLPISRTTQTLVRLTVALTATIAMIGVHLAVLAICDRYQSNLWRSPGGPAWTYPAYAAAMFGIAWLLSAHLRSTPIAASIGIGLPILAYLSANVVFDLVGEGRWQSYELTTTLARALTVAAMATLVFGTIQASRRVEA